MRYTIQHPYKAYRDGRLFGPWDQGDVVDLDDADAAWIERDSPGVFAEDVDETADQQPAPSGPPIPERQGEPIVDQGDREPPAPDYEAMDYRELQALAKQRELPASGSKDDLVARLQKADKAAAADGART
ncbi:SAP domain-containing protein [Actinokineospora sp. UTMC 2448]|uniref:SAP domain-containing protein n=1 Tax=Actinokineospora sp. UTMC 2448 TaxID=2268449 RepID=UPI0021645347|nr:SAP domain-containing protein [Actinokineospora sp. UTMC 2448]UVS81840.1 SAP domain protein [Actinokineospora sp. UTMC 2448]